MRHYKNIFLFFLYVLLAGLAGCGGGGETGTVVKVKVDETGQGKEESLDSKSVSILASRTSEPMLPVYFDYDSSEIRKSQISRMQINAEFLQKEPAVLIRIEGNCDPRGTREYNLALGERRALSAKKYLIRLGLAEDRLETISYGDERILMQGKGEDAWSQNRRDDFVILGGRDDPFAKPSVGNN